MHCDLEQQLPCVQGCNVWLCEASITVAACVITATIGLCTLIDICACGIARVSCVAAACVAPIIVAACVITTTIGYRTLICISAAIQAPHTWPTAA